jgi:hypothetical protein
MPSCEESAGNQRRHARSVILAPTTAATVSDIGCFQTKFALGDPYADCNGDGVRNLSDFGCFQTKFALGCP